MSRRSRTAGHRRRTGFGFNMPVGLADPLNTVAKYQADIDTLAASNMQWIRRGVPSWDITSGGNTTSINWNTTNLTQWDAILQYAYDKGFRIVLQLSGAPDYAQNYSFADYQNVTSIYWTFLANRWKNLVSLWSLFNEADASHYRLFTSLPSLTTGYLTELNTLFGMARSIFHTAAPGSLITTTSTGWPMDDARQTWWQAYFDGFHEQLDVITLHMYPADNMTEIQKLGDRITSTRARYQKPVAMTELGMQTPANVGAWTEADQLTYLPPSVTYLKAGLPKLVTLYAYRDEGLPTTTDGEMAFGITHNDRTPKTCYDAVLNAMGRVGGGGAGSAAVRSAASGSTTGTGSVTVTKPTDTQSGDVLVALLFMDIEALVADVTVPAGFSAAGQDSHTQLGTDDGGIIHVFRKVAGGSEPANYTFDRTSGTGMVVHVLALTGVNTTTPIASGPTYANSNWGYNTHVAPSVTGVNGGVLICGFTSGSATSASYTPPTDMTEQGDLYTGSWRYASVATQTLISGGATGSRTATATVSDTYATVSLVIAPAS